MSAIHDLRNLKPDELRDHRAALVEFNARLGAEDEAGQRLLEALQAKFLRIFFKKYDATLKDFIKRAGELIEAEDAAERIAELFVTEFSQRFPNVVLADLRNSIKEICRAGGNIPVSKNWKKRTVPEAAIEWFTKANHFDLGNAFARHADLIKSAAIEALKSGNRSKVLKELASRIPGAAEDVRLKDRLEDIFRNLTNRSYSFSRVKRMESLGIEKIEVVAVLDRRTSAICHLMDGKTFSISTASRFVDEFIGTEYDESFWTKFQNPSFEPSADEVEKAGGRKEAIAKKIAPLRKLSGDEIVKQLGVPLPPYHFKCRTAVVASV